MWPSSLVPPVAFVAFTLAGALWLPGLGQAPVGSIGRLAALLMGVCAQRLGHSYTLAGQQLPLEARETGIYGGFLAGVLVLGTVGRQRARCLPKLPLGLMLLGGAASMALDGLNAVLFDLGLPHAYPPDLRWRLLTGLLAGIALAFAVVPTMARPHSDIPEAVGPRPNWVDAGLALLVGLAFGLLVASGWQVLLYPVALASAAGVLLLLAMVNRVWLGRPQMRQMVCRLGIEGAAARNLLASLLVIAELVALADLRSILLPL